MRLLRFLASWRKGVGAPDGAAHAGGVAPPARGERSAAPAAGPKPAGAKARVAKAPKPQVGTARAASTPPIPGVTARSAVAAQPAPVRAAEGPRREHPAGPGLALAGAAAPVPPSVPRGVFDQAIDLPELEMIFRGGAPGSAGATVLDHDTADKAAVRELFAGIAGQQSTPVKDLVFELKRFTAGKNWIEICRPVMATLVQAAESLDLTTEAREMKEFVAALELAGEGESGLVEPAARDLLLAAYERMAAVFPEAFALGEDSHRRDVIVIHSLLQQVPDVGRVTFDRLFGAGVTTLESLFAATPLELATTTDIPIWLSERICEKLNEHRAELEHSAGPESRSADRERLASLLDEIKLLHAAYDRAAEAEWRDPAEAEAKSAARKDRQVVALKIEVLLAEMGELDLVEQFQKLSFEMRIRSLELFLGPGKAPARAASAAPQER